MCNYIGKSIKKNPGSVFELGFFIVLLNVSAKNILAVALAGLRDAIADATVQTINLLLQPLTVGRIGAGRELGQTDELGAKLLHGIVKGLPLIVEHGARHTRGAGMLIKLDGYLARL